MAAKFSRAFAALMLGAGTLPAPVHAEGVVPVLSLAVTSKTNNSALQPGARAITAIWLIVSKASNAVIKGAVIKGAVIKGAVIEDSVRKAVREFIAADGKQTETKKAGL